MSQQFPGLGMVFLLYLSSRDWLGLSSCSVYPVTWHPRMCLPASARLPALWFSRLIAFTSLGQPSGPRNMTQATLHLYVFVLCSPLGESACLVSGKVELAKEPREEEIMATLHPWWRGVFSDTERPLAFLYGKGS